MPFVKPNAIKVDPRAQEEQDRELAGRTQDNLFHIQKQLIAHGHSIEAVLTAAAKAHLGVNIHPYAPVDKPDALVA